MFANLSGWHLLILVAVVLLLFGATRLPALAKGVGQSARILRKELKQVAEPGPVTGSEHPTIEAGTVER